MKLSMLDVSLIFSYMTPCSLVEITDDSEERIAIASNSSKQARKKHSYCLHGLHFDSENRGNFIIGGAVLSP
jgi:hypothetical protein